MKRDEIIKEYINKRLNNKYIKKDIQKYIDNSLLNKSSKNPIDLRKCTKGDILISSHGTILKYISTTPWKNITHLDHVVEYLIGSDGSLYSNSYGTRTHDGFVYKNKRIPETDDDIIEIIKK